MLRLIVLAAFSIAASVTLCAQPFQTIRGTVVDHASNVPLANATIEILKANEGAVSDSLGNFVLRNVAVGRYDVRVSLIGYEPFVMKELMVSSGKEVLLQVALLERATTLGEVIVKPGVNKEQPLNPTATVSARMLSVEEARRYAGGFDDPARLVSSFAGVSSNVTNNALVVRGNSPQALQWRLEGVEIPNPNHFADLNTFGGGGLTALSSQLLANSDFFAGAMPAEYNNALAGVFDIFMRKGNNKESEHTFQLGLLGIDVSSEGPFRRNGQSSWLFNYRYSTLGLLEPLLPENAGGTTFQDLSFKLNFPTKKAGTFSIWGMGLTDGSGAEAKMNRAEWKYDTDRETQDVKQFMAAGGVTHKLFLNSRQYVRSALAVTVSGIDLRTDRLNNDLLLLPKEKINNKSWNLVFSSFLNTKFNARHTNRTGFTATGLFYDLSLKSAAGGTPLQSIVSENGNSALLSAYSNSTLHFSDKWTMNAGISTQLFTLDRKYTLEPRVGIRYQLAPLQSLSFGYGLHSRLERLNYYFIRNSQNGNEPVNKDMGFTKSHHLVAGYAISLSEFTHLKAEVYYQHLFDVPVMADSSFSMINQQNDWFFDGKLYQSGKGRNYGLDVSLERYLSKGYYYMLTASVFDSRYKGGDGVWRSTRYNRNFAFNFLVGKEWATGRNNQNVFGLNTRLSYQGGDHYSPINITASSSSQEAVFDENRAFSLQGAPAFTAHFTASYRINKKRSAREIAVKIINVTGYREFMGFQYNYQTQMVDVHREAVFIPNLSYKIEF